MLLVVTKKLRSLRSSLKNPADNRTVFITLQWLVAISTSYLSLFVEGELVDDPRVSALAVALLASVLVLYRLPRELFQRRFFPHGVIVIDTILISIGIALNRENPWDLFILLFFAIFVAAIGDRLVEIVAACLVLSLGVLAVSQLQGKSLSELDPHVFYRIPFVFAVSILYGYIAERAKKETASALQTAERMKAEFLAIMSHELRTPLNIVINYTAAVQNKILGEINAQQENALEKVSKHSRELLLMINEILEVSRIGAEIPVAVPEKTDVKHFVHELRTSYDRPLDRDVTLRWDYPEEFPVVRIDSTKLKHILWNLINNAIKYTETGSVTVAARCLGKERVLEFRVEDTGNGLPGNAVPQSSENSNAYSEIGMGVQIVKRFTEMLAGTLEFRSDPDKGPALIVKIPYREA
jgi:signal transduction histidine kinase